VKHLLTILFGVIIISGWLLAVIVNGYEQRVRNARLGISRYRFYGGHGVILGWSSMGPFVVSKLFQKECNEVVILALHNAEEVKNQCKAYLGNTQHLGKMKYITALTGSFVSQKELKTLNLPCAATVVVLGDEEIRGADGRNLHVSFEIAQLAKQAARDTRLPCYIHIANLRSYDLLQEVDISEEFRDVISLYSFNFYEDWARKLWSLIPRPDEQISYKPLAYVPFSQDCDLAVHLVVIGFEQMGRAVAAQAARLAHYANGRKTRITIIDSELEHRKHEFLSHYHAEALVYDIVFDYLEAHAESTLVRQFLMDLVLDETQAPTIAICLPDPDLALATALALPREVHRSSVPILVQQETQYGITGLIGRIKDEYKTVNIYPFGMLEKCYGLDAHNDILPKTIHEEYLATSKRAGCYNPTLPQHQPWDRLPERYRWSNRFQGDSYLETIYSMGYSLCQRREVGSLLEFSDDDVEWLAEREHDRWWAERLLAGWQLGSRDDASMRHPNLVPFSELNETTKDYDRNTVLLMPRILYKSYGLTICSKESAREKIVYRQL